MEVPGKRKQNGALWRAFAQRSHIYAVLAIVLSFMLMGGLRAMATPLVDNLGGNPDEVFHFARSLGWARELAEYFGLPAPLFSEEELSVLATRVVDLRDLGIIKGNDRAGYTLPLGSGEIRGSGVYLLHGLSQLLLPVSDTYSRLLLGRIMALGVGLALVWVAYNLGWLLFDDRRLAVAAAALIVLLPSVNGILSVLSTEGPALLAVALLLWATVAIYLSGFSLGRLFGIGLGVLACVFTKISALVVLPVSGMMLLQRAGFRWRGLLLAMLASISLACLVLVAEPPRSAGVAHWYLQRAPETVPIYGATAQMAVQFDSLKMNLETLPPELGLIPPPPTGINAIQTAAPRDLYNDIVQILPSKVARGLAGKVLSFGAWVYSGEGVVIPVPKVVVASNNSEQIIMSNGLVTARGEWQFLAYEIQLPAQVSDVVVRLPTGFEIPTGRQRAALLSGVQGQETNKQSNAARTRTVLWDGIILATGSYAASGEPPIYDDVDATTGEWGGARFHNILKNGSGEEIWRHAPSTLKYLVSQFGTSTLANRLDGQMFSLYDFERTSAGYLAGIRAIFVTFWGSFVGGDWPGLSRWHYGVVVVVLVLASLGWLRLVWGRFTMAEVMPISVAFAFLVAALVYVFIGIVRMDVSAEWVPPLFYATARHLLPAITPVVLLTVGGLAQLFSKRVTRAVLALLIAGVFLANTWMLLRVELPYFSCSLEIRWGCTAL